MGRRSRLRALRIRLRIAQFRGLAPAVCINTENESVASENVFEATRRRFRLSSAATPTGNRGGRRQLRRTGMNLLKRRALAPTLVGTLALAAQGASAQDLVWARYGDIDSLDPHRAT